MEPTPPPSSEHRRWPREEVTTVEPIPDRSEEPSVQMSVSAVADLQDSLLVAMNDLKRLEGLLDHATANLLDRFNTAKLDSFVTFDLRFGLRSDAWDVTFYAENLFNDDTVKTSLGIINLQDIAVLAAFNGNPPPTTVILPPSQLATLPDLRQFGIRASFRFGGN